MAFIYPLTNQAHKLLGILQAHKSWMSRKDLALVLHREILTPYTITLLQDLEERELIEVRQVISAVKNPHYEYRAKQT